MFALLTGFDILVEDLDMLVTVTTSLFMVKTQSMEKFMLDSVKVNTSIVF